MKLHLEIELEDDTMKTGSDLAEALVGVANRLAGTSATALRKDKPGQKICDDKGSSVGLWEIRES